MTSLRRERRRVLALLGSALTAMARPAAVRAAASFRVFDALLHRGKPAHVHAGVEPLTAIAGIWRPDVSHATLDEPGVAAALAAVARDARSVCFDIEAWPFLQVPDAQRDASIANLVQVARLTRRLRPDLHFGFYGAPPVITYWPILLRDPPSLAAWRAANERLASVAALADMVFPSLYTFYPDREGWLRYAGAQLDAARGYGRPVYPFLWFEYHDSNVELAGRELPVDMWREQLDFCRQHADGVVLWGGWQRDWSESALWWQAALESLGLKASGAQVER